MTAASLREPEGSSMWPVSSRALMTKADNSRLQLRTSCHTDTQTPRGHEASDIIITWLPDQGMSERGPGSQMWSGRMLFIVIYVGLAESRFWWSFLINIFYSLKIKDENWSLELFNEILEIFKLCGFNKVHHAHGFFFFLIYFYFRFLLCISTSLNVSNLHNNFPVNTISNLCGGSIN